ncbi:kynureninase [Actinomadura pelletieri DSM 43383]|uniref:Kynureninase n=1 Tax=Actinomadura pelletieri DSM 43383 TaxID=1120940 RepID=A0A495Q9M9_9ACTN|nr:kynureninase [Actinomadura pelletieri]RKS67796.1 kynureninase [Actinomadura pelletieri DSM 43383]
MNLEREARRLDETDPLPTLRDEFLVPPAPGGAHDQTAYFAGNSLGLQPRTVAERLREELDDWATLAVEAHTRGRRPWVDYHERLREPTARLVGARPHEVVAMNSLTVNLHLMMASFYRPAGTRTRIVIEDSAFPSDSYAVASQAVHHGLDPARTVVRLTPRPGEDVPRTEDVIAHLERLGDTVALVLLGGVNYLTGQLMDIPAITKAGRAAGAVVGWDLAHAAGNVPLRLHDWDVDFAAWCTYKYLNSGPGAVAACFVHERHVRDASVPKLSGWWGTDPSVRFRMDPDIAPPASADAWQLSNPPIMALAPVLASLEIFDRVGMDALRAKSERLTGYLASRLAPVEGLAVITPPDPAARGAQLSLRVDDAGALVRRLAEKHGVVADAREPDVVRLAPAPLYCTFHDCHRAAEALRDLLP